MEHREIYDGEIEQVLGHSISEQQGEQIRAALRPYVAVVRRHRAKPPRNAAGRQHSFGVAIDKIRRIAPVNNAGEPTDLDNILRLLHTARDL